MRKKIAEILLSNEIIHKKPWRRRCKYTIMVATKCNWFMCVRMGWQVWLANCEWNTINLESRNNLLCFSNSWTLTFWVRIVVVVVDKNLWSDYAVCKSEAYTIRMQSENKPLAKLDRGKKHDKLEPRTSKHHTHNKFYRIY